MKLIIDLVNIDSAQIMDSVIFVVGFFITATFVLFKIFSKETPEKPEEMDYYSRHHLPIKNKEKDKIY